MTIEQAELYRPLFEEAALRNGLPLFDEITLYAMHVFGGYDMQAALQPAIKGAMLGLVFWLVLGRVAVLLVEKFPDKELLENRHQMAPYAKWAVPLCMCISWLPVGFAVAFAAGFFRSSLLTIFPIMLMSQFGYYAYILFG